MDVRKIVILTTGGTIEKSYSEFDGTLKNRSSLLKRRLMAKLRLPHTQIDLIEVMAKDSLQMNDEDREIILKEAERALERGVPLLILHGTDTMEITAKYFFDKLNNLQHPVIFTGAMKPMGFDDSDASQNFIEALMACNLAQPGVYISFHNRLFTVPNVKKNRQKRTFQSLES